MNVKDHGAKGKGVANDTVAIQAAVDAVKGIGGTVLVPGGTYLVGPITNGGAGIRLGSDMTFRIYLPRIQEEYRVDAQQEAQRPRWKPSGPAPRSSICRDTPRTASPRGVSSRKAPTSSRSPLIRAP